MALNRMKVCAALLLIREMQITIPWDTISRIPDWQNSRSCRSPSRSAQDWDRWEGRPRSWAWTATRGFRFRRWFPLGPTPPAAQGRAGSPGWGGETTQGWETGHRGRMSSIQKHKHWPYHSTLKCLPCAEHCPGLWGFSSEQNSPKSSSFWVLRSDFLLTFLAVLLSGLGNVQALNHSHPYGLPEDSSHPSGKVIS